MEAIQRLPRTNEWVFPGQHGKPWSLASAGKTWEIIRRRWGFDDVCLHDLRRTCASQLAITGENLPTIQNVLNHRSLAPTSIYARLNTKAVDRALQDQADRLCGLVPHSTAEVLEAPASLSRSPEGRPVHIIEPAPALLKSSDVNVLQGRADLSQILEVPSMEGDDAEGRDGATEWPG
jgi:hypothetical protein